jgi:prevent-host-death family protein
MPANTSVEMGIRELRESLSDVVMETATRGRVTFVTNRGRRVAAIVPLPFGESAEAELDKRSGQSPA